MSDKLDKAAAAARKSQAEYLEGLQREAKAYKDAGRKDRLTEVQSEIKRVEATLEPAGKSGTTTTRGGSGKAGKGAGDDKADKAGKDATGDGSKAPAADATGSGDGGSDEKTGA